MPLSFGASLLDLCHYDPQCTDPSLISPLTSVAPSISTDLMFAIEEAAVPFLPDFGPAYMSELLWSLAVLGHKPSPDFISVGACNPCYLVIEHPGCLSFQALLPEPDREIPLSPPTCCLSCHRRRWR